MLGGAGSVGRGWYCWAELAVLGGAGIVGRGWQCWLGLAVLGGASSVGWGWQCWAGLAVLVGAGSVGRGWQCWAGLAVLGGASSVVVNITCSISNDIHICMGEPPTNVSAVITCLSTFLPYAVPFALISHSVPPPSFLPATMTHPI